MKLLRNLNLLRPCSEKPYLENAYLVIEDDTFLSISTSEPGGEFEEVLDCKGKFALPGLINAHHHLYSTLAVGMPPPGKTPNNFVDPTCMLALDRSCPSKAFALNVFAALRGSSKLFIKPSRSP